MVQKKIARYMMGAGGMAALGIIIVFGIYVPILVGELKQAYPEYAALYWPGLLGLWAIAALFLLGLWEYFQVCVRIGKEQSFCMANTRSLGRIALYMTLGGVLWLSAVFAPGLVFHLSIGPAWLLFFLCALASFALGILAWGLGKLLHKAVALQEENDLTV